VAGPVLGLFFGLAWLVVASGSARADGADAKARYMSGQSHYNLNEFAEALQDFKEAYRLHPDPAFLFNIAQCERQLGDFDEAIKFYRSYLRNKPDAGNAKEVQKKIDELKVLSEGKRKSKEGAPAGVTAPSTTPPPADTHAPPPVPPVAPLSPPPPAAAAPANAPPPAPVPDLSPSTAAATTSTSAPGADLTAKADTGEGAPIYKQWWFWAGAGAVVVGAVVVAIVATSGSASAPSSALGNKKVF
jgi:tetratricopeptide (TPR) repeat protein